MIEAGLEFEKMNDGIMMAFASLPAPIRPVYFSEEENATNDANRIVDQKRLAAFIAKSTSGFFLLGSGVTYSIRIAAERPLVCDCFIDVVPDLAEEFLTHMSRARPAFGFACAPAERERLNRVTTKQGLNKIESWVGRDTRKYIPGLYWLTLLPESLARMHGVALSALEAVAQKHIELENGQHLFRFYERPEDWQTMSALSKLDPSLSGVFDIEKVKPQLLAAKNFLDLSALLREWR